MSKAKTPSFVAELPLTVQPRDERVLLDRLEVARRLYNATLQEALLRLDLMRQSKAWQSARKMKKGAARTKAFRTCQQHFGFDEYALHALAARHKNAAGFSARMSANELQKLASRVWQAVEAYAYGQRGRPRFKGAHRPLHSIEGKSNKQGIRWQAETGCVVWNGVYMPARLPTAAQDPYLAEALQARTKYVRLVWRIEHGKRRWYAQLMQEGQAPQKYDFRADGEVVGLDIGTSKVAIVAEGAAGLELLAPSVKQPWTESRRLQRALDRSRRANNPDNYHADGTVKKGARQWHKSKRYKKLQARHAEIERKLAAARKRDHGQLANKIIALGNVVQTEKLSYKSFQRNFGRSVKVRAPGAFIQLLSRKAESAGGRLVELDTWRLKMSQYDHATETCTKKPLKQRWHRVGGGDVLAQRDAYSAWLARHVSDGQHNPRWLEESWPAAEALLRRAGLCIQKPVSGKDPSEPTVALPSEPVARQRRLAQSLNQDDVGHSAESPEALCAQCL